MAEITKRTLIAAGGAALAAGAAHAQGPQAGSFVTRHSGEFNGRRVEFVATVGEILVGGGERPAARFVCTSYVVRGADPARRPVLFAFNGGPSSSSQTLHMLALGPKRIAVPQDPEALFGPPYEVVDNHEAVLDVADLVFIDPAETGFSRMSPDARREYFYSVEGDAQSVADFVVAWCRANGREASPKYVLGESYGTIRAAFMAGQLARTMPLDGVFLFGQAVNMIETSQRAKNAISYATNLTALAAIAAYHGKAARRGRSMTAIVDEAYRWGMGEYLQALLKGFDQSERERRRVAAKLQTVTGISADYYLKNDLAITKIEYARELLRPEGLMLGTYDARYVGPLPKPGERPLDPFGKVQAAINPAMMEHYRTRLGVTLPVADYRSVAPGVSAWTWAPTLGPGGPFHDFDYAARITPAFQANARFRLMVGTGIYDLTTTVGPARYLVARSDWPRNRVFQRQYEGGHMAYTHLPSLRAFNADIRAWVSGGAPSSAAA